MGLILIVSGASIAHGQGTAALSKPAANTERLAAAIDGDRHDILTRGALHEAFAAPVNLNPLPPPVIPDRPPEPVDELPPAYRPADLSVQWIPGYWTWDNDLEKFIWTSGVWRAAPSGHRWMPGYWSRNADGYRRIAGYWSPTALDRVEYLILPPETLEEGPIGKPPSANHIWVPGCWLSEKKRYHWRPGYWAGAKRNRMWIAANYVWTPRGAVFVDGHWDAPFASRGLMFAPIDFQIDGDPPPTEPFSPGTVIQARLLTDHLFSARSAPSYYFGDYYGDESSARGIVPWFSEGIHGRLYDPVRAYYACELHQRDPSWDRRYRAVYEHLLQHAEARPPRTLKEQGTALRGQAGAREQGAEFALATSLADAAADKSSAVRLRRVDAAERRALGESLHEMRRVAIERAELEAKPKPAQVRTAARPGEEGDSPVPPIPSALGLDGLVLEHPVPDRTAASPRADAASAREKSQIREKRKERR